LDCCHQWFSFKKFDNVSDIDPQHIDSRHLDSRHLDPRHIDPRDIDPRDIDPRHGPTSAKGTRRHEIEPTVQTSPSASKRNQIRTA
jgi:hypothetical protein